MAATDVRTALAEQRRKQTPASWLTVVKQAVKEWGDDDVMTWAAACACYTLLALAPLMVIAVKVLAVIYGSSGAGEKIQNQARDWMGDAGSQVVAQILQNAGRHGSGIIATIVSAALVVVSAGGVFAEFQQAMNRIWKVTPKKRGALWPWLRARLLSVVVVGVTALLLIASVYVSTWLHKLAFGRRFLVLSIDGAVSVAVLTVLFALMYKTVPDAQINWRSTWLGAFISAVLFQIGKYGLTFYFRFASPSSAFGAVGSLAAVLIWIYYSSMIVFFGAEFTQVYAKLRGYGVKPSKHARPLSECDETETATPSEEPPGQKPPKPVTLRDGRRAPGAPSPQYAAVLGPHARPHSPMPAGPPVQAEIMTRSYLAAGAGLAVGALIGGFGALQWRRPAAPRSKEIAASRLEQRIKRVEHKVGHVSRIKRYLEREDVNERIEELERKIRRACNTRRRPRRSRQGGTWAGRLTQVVKTWL